MGGEAPQEPRPGEARAPRPGRARAARALAWVSRTGRAREHGWAGVLRLQPLRHGLRVALPVDRPHPHRGWARLGLHQAGGRHRSRPRSLEAGPRFRVRERPMAARRAPRHPEARPAELHLRRQPLALWPRDRRQHPGHPHHHASRPPLRGEHGASGGARPPRRAAAEDPRLRLGADRPLRRARDPYQDRGDRRRGAEQPAAHRL